jgi:hypothetical protein
MSPQSNLSEPDEVTVEQSQPETPPVRLILMTVLSNVLKILI